MKLSSVRIKEFKSIRDTTEFKVGDITCLVGRNESGKTAILQALYRLNPIVTNQGNFDVTSDYPRAEEENYQQKIESKQRSHATVVFAKFTLEQDELQKIRAEFGDSVLENAILVLRKGYDNVLRHCLDLDERASGAFLLSNADLADVEGWTTLKELQTVLEKRAQGQQEQFASANAAANALSDPAEKAKAIAEAALKQESNKAKLLRERLAEVLKTGLITYIYKKYLETNIPKFLYFDEYYQMEGQLNIEHLKQRQANGNLKDSDRPMLGLIELARLNLDQLMSTGRTEALLNKLEGASNHLTRQILKYWSQNKHLSVRFDVRPARPQDPPEMQQGTNLWGLVTDSVHMASTRLGTRSKGFVWFFSFLAWFSQQRKNPSKLILLLDEPGLALHGTAQGDLLRYMEAELKPHHQVIYTTHSPFMVDPQHFERIRIVEDKSTELEPGLETEVEGTKVYTDVLDVSQGSLFPLQGALGYEISQTLFVGPNTLVVEGASDLLYIQALSAILEVYIQALSAILEANGRQGLDKMWVITPVGGSDKIPTFAALLGAQKHLNIATLIDIQNKDRQSIENLYKHKLLKQKQVITFAEFTGKDEADVEDMFDPDFYLKLVNEEFKNQLQQPVATSDLLHTNRRILVSIEEYFRRYPLKNGKFNHYRPARYLNEHIGELGKELYGGTLDRFESVFKRLNGLLKE